MENFLKFCHVHVPRYFLAWAIFSLTISINKIDYCIVCIMQMFSRRFVNKDYEKWGLSRATLWLGFLTGCFKVWLVNTQEYCFLIGHHDHVYIIQHISKTRNAHLICTISNIFIMKNFPLSSGKAFTPCMWLSRIYLNLIMIFSLFNALLRSFKTKVCWSVCPPKITKNTKLYKTLQINTKHWNILKFLPPTPSFMNTIKEALAVCRSFLDRIVIFFLGGGVHLEEGSGSI